MKKYKLAILFTQPPFGSATSREGLDALLAASAFCEETEILICFLHDGVFNLLGHQQPERLMQKDHISTFKLIELYALSECFICTESVTERNLQNAEWIFSTFKSISRAEMFEKFSHAEKILTF